MRVDDSSLLVVTHKRSARLCRLPCGKAQPFRSSTTTGEAAPHVSHFWSSVRYWQGKPLDDEPLVMDIEQIAWHK
jgi:hypothetical protein